MSGIVCDELRRRDNDIRMDRLERVHQPRALLSDRLQRVAICVARWDPLRRRLKERACRQTDFGRRTLHAEKQCRDPSHERGRHRRAGEHSERPQRDRERRQDVPARRSDRGLEEEVIRGPEAREAGDEAAGGVGEVEAPS